MWDYLLDDSPLSCVLATALLPWTTSLQGEVPARTGCAIPRNQGWGFGPHISWCLAEGWTIFTSILSWGDRSKSWWGDMCNVMQPHGCAKDRVVSMIQQQQSCRRLP